MASRTLTLISKLSKTPSLLRLRPLFPAVAAPLCRPFLFPAAGGSRTFSTRPATSSLNDPSPNWSNRPPKETILLDGCDFEHWLCVVEPPEPNLTRDEIIDSYIKILAQVLGSEEEAKNHIFSPHKTLLCFWMHRV
ncbi:multiple organellar RNA editing factor 8, chloroplastic/mitochondrial-like [Iris pallida]|uniref:Multiple organellar RNA editing factor 8, chloroplastic/mitochondrial-like n=1 Tax=Iris pallida TaxID=29817 RepID=A0AAX6FLC1_IRIPA|nr:multiple organellar RNA editing factor 8, chloroplastic/mitochondrial-like [Iris pallida]